MRSPRGSRTREPYKVADKLRPDVSESAYDVWVPDSTRWTQRADPGDGNTRRRGGAAAEPPYGRTAEPPDRPQRPGSAGSGSPTGQVCTGSPACISSQ